MWECNHKKEMFSFVRCSIKLCHPIFESQQPHIILHNPSQPLFCFSQCPYLLIMCLHSLVFPDESYECNAFFHAANQTVLLHYHSIITQLFWPQKKNSWQMFIWLNSWFPGRIYGMPQQMVASHVEQMWFAWSFTVTWDWLQPPVTFKGSAGYLMYWWTSCKTTALVL